MLSIDTKNVSENIKSFNSEITRYNDAINDIFSTLNSLRECMSGVDVENYLEAINNSNDYKTYLEVGERLGLIVKHLDSVNEDVISFVNDNTLN